MDPEIMRSLQSAVGSVLYNSGPRRLDAASVNRLRESFLLTDAADGDPVHAAFLGQLPRLWCDLSVDRRPEAPLGLDLGQGMNGGVRMTVTRPCHVGDVLTAEATLDSVETKDGRTGTLLLVTVLRRITDGNGECARFYRTTVYRADAATERA